MTVRFVVLLPSILERYIAEMSCTRSGGTPSSFALVDSSYIISRHACFTLSGVSTYWLRDALGFVALGSGV